MKSRADHEQPLLAIEAQYQAEVEHRESGSGWF
jgi:hypothetical protein